VDGGIALDFAKISDVIGELPVPVDECAAAYAERRRDFLERILPGRALKAALSRPRLAIYQNSSQAIRVRLRLGLGKLGHYRELQGN
jgi:hypothetical protein